MSDTTTPIDAARTILRGANDAVSFQEGLTAAERLADSGDPEAQAFTAVLDALGAGRQRDWQASFDRLEQAALAGSGFAHDQLRMLSRQDGEPAELRRAIDLDALLASPPAKDISTRPRLRAIPGFASSAECGWVIYRLSPFLGPAMVWHSASGTVTEDPARSNRSVELRVSEMDVMMAVLRARIAAAIRTPEANFEVPQFMHYAPGQAFEPHFDYLDPRDPTQAQDMAMRGQRIGTFLLYLNEGYEGGETEFPDGAVSFKGKTGDGMVFANILPDGQPDPLTRHAGRPPTSGEKFLLSQWIRHRPPSMGPDA